jgi:hypothetical protein
LKLIDILRFDRFVALSYNHQGWVSRTNPDQQEDCHRNEHQGENTLYQSVDYVRLHCALSIRSAPETLVWGP